MSRAARNLASVFLATLAACGGGSASAPATAPAPAAASIDSTKFAADLDVDLRQFTRLSSGMYVNDVIKGTGVVAAEGRKVTFRYAAFLPSGAIVESQRQPIEAEIGEGMLKGLRFGLAGMHAGGQRRLIVPPSLGYGRTQYGKVPPNSILVFDVELLSVR